MIWQMIGVNKKSGAARFLEVYWATDFENLKSSGSLLQELYVNAKDRKYQIWERNALSIPLYSDAVFMQKLNYIHNNPVVAGLCGVPEDYCYSSAAYYYRQVNDFEFSEAL
jgi:putative transposase